jgi:hypothetical protein
LVSASCTVRNRPTSMCDVSALLARHLSSGKPGPFAHRVQHPGSGGTSRDRRASRRRRRLSCAFPSIHTDCSCRSSLLPRPPVALEERSHTSARKTTVASPGGPSWSPRHRRVPPPGLEFGRELCRCCRESICVSTVSNARPKTPRRPPGLPGPGPAASSQVAQATSDRHAGDGGCVPLGATPGRPHVIRLLVRLLHILLAENLEIAVTSASRRRAAAPSSPARPRGDDLVRLLLDPSVLLDVSISGGPPHISRKSALCPFPRRDRRLTILSRLGVEFLHTVHLPNHFFPAIRGRGPNYLPATEKGG